MTKQDVAAGNLTKHNADHEPTPIWRLSPGFLFILVLFFFATKGNTIDVDPDQPSARP